jgi:excisionase family DNA binding protein
VLWTVKNTARYLGVELYQVYYLLSMGEIEGVKIGKAWRMAPEAVKEYDKRFPERKNRGSSGYFIYPGSGGFLFTTLPDRIPPDSHGETAGMERLRRKLVHSPQRHQTVLLEKLKPVTQLELFTA